MNVIGIDFPPVIVMIMTFVVSFFIAYLSIPSIVGVAQQKKFFDEPSRRKSHAVQTPTLGGVAIFAGFALSACFFIDFDHSFSLQYILLACTIIFFLGIKDDILGVPPLQKIIWQIVASLILILSGNLSFTNLHGFFGINDIPFIASLFLTLFAVVVIINSFNLIDGIDGLAASVGMLTTAFFGIWFFISGNIDFSMISAAMFGTLLGFFWFNVFGGKNKVFMGDTGSLIVGLIMAVQVILFNEKNIDLSSAFSIKSAPAVSFSVLIIPLFDTLRVFFIRVSRGRSPFAADKNHLHHCLLRIGFNHVKSTRVIVFINICFIVLALLLQNMRIEFLMLIILGIATILSFYLESLVKKKGQHHVPDEAIQEHQQNL